MSFRHALNYMGAPDSLRNNDFLDEQEMLEKRTNRWGKFGFTEKQLYEILDCRSKGMIGSHWNSILNSDGEIDIFDGERKYMSIKHDGNVYGHQILQGDLIAYYGLADVLEKRYTKKIHDNFIALGYTHDCGEARTLSGDIIIDEKENDQKEIDMFDEYIRGVESHLHVFKDSGDLTEHQNKLVYEAEKKLLKIYEINDSLDKEDDEYIQFSWFEKMSYMLGGVYALQDSPHLNSLKKLLNNLLTRQMKSIQPALQAGSPSMMLFLYEHQEYIDSLFEHNLEGDPSNDLLAAYTVWQQVQVLFTSKENYLHELGLKVSELALSQKFANKNFEVMPTYQ